MDFRIIKERGLSVGRSRATRVVLEVALSVMLLVGAAAAPIGARDTRGSRCLPALGMNRSISPQRSADKDQTHEHKDTSGARATSPVRQSWSQAGSSRFVGKPEVGPITEFEEIIVQRLVRASND